METKYIIAIYQGKDETSEITYSFSNPYIARQLAIKEFKKIQIAAVKQLSGLEEDNLYGIHHHSCYDENQEYPRFKPDKVPFALELILDLGSTQYTLFGAGQDETLEALIAECSQYRLDNLIKDQELKTVYKNDSYNPALLSSRTEYTLNKREAEKSTSDFSEHLIFKESLGDLLGYE